MAIARITRKKTSSQIDAAHNIYRVEYLGIDPLIRKDKRDGAWVLMITWVEAPDLFFEFDFKGTNLTVYSNVLTEINFEKQPIEAYHKFLMQVLNLQSQYYNVRVCTGTYSRSDSNIIKLFNRYKSNMLDIEMMAELIYDAKRFLNDIQELIVEYELMEVWREMEGEPPSEKYNLNFYDYL